MKVINVLHLYLRNQNRPLIGTGAKRVVCPCSSESTMAKFPVTSAESVPMDVVRVGVYVASRQSVCFS